LLILAVMKVVVKQKIVGDNETSQFLSWRASVRLMPFILDFKKILTCFYE
jgi:hypothetical protein